MGWVRWRERGEVFAGLEGRGTRGLTHGAGAVKA